MHDKKQPAALTVEQRRATADAGVPDPRLVAFVRLLARHAARLDHDKELRERPNSANPDGSSSETES